MSPLKASDPPPEKKKSNKYGIGFRVEGIGALYPDPTRPSLSRALIMLILVFRGLGALRGVGFRAYSAGA